MRCVVFGPTGAAGTGVVEACIASPEVEEAVAVTRRTLGRESGKLRAVFCEDFSSPPRLEGLDACFYCLGVSTLQEPDPDRYREITFDYALAALRALPEACVFHFISGSGTNPKSRFHWARVKGETEIALRETGRPVVCWRPGYIRPIRKRENAPVSEKVMRILYPFMKWIPSASVRAEQLGRAMIRAQQIGIRDGIIDNRRIRELAEA